MGLVCECRPRRACAPCTAPLGPAIGRVPRPERVAVAEIQDRQCSHLPLESDAREEKRSYKFNAESGKPEGVQI